MNDFFRVVWRSLFGQLSGLASKLIERLFPDWCGQLLDIAGIVAVDTLLQLLDVLVHSVKVTFVIEVLVYLLFENAFLVCAENLQNSLFKNGFGEIGLPVEAEYFIVALTQGHNVPRQVCVLVQQVLNDFILLNAVDLSMNSILVEIDWTLNFLRLEVYHFMLIENDVDRCVEKLNELVLLNGVPNLAINVVDNWILLKFLDLFDELSSELTFTKLWIELLGQMVLNFLLQNRWGRLRHGKKEVEIDGGMEGSWS